MKTKLNYSFHNIDIFTYINADKLSDFNERICYDVIFCLDSMKQYNHCDVIINYDNSIEIFNSNTLIWSGSPIEIKEVVSKLNENNIIVL